MTQHTSSPHSSPHSPHHRPARPARQRLSGLLALAWMLSASAVPVSALAHDTWFAAAPADAGVGALALGTGNLYPKHEFAVGAEYLARQGCRAETGPAQPLRPLRLTDTALLLAAPAPGTSTCWAQLQPFEIEIAPDKVAVYFDEIRPPAALRQRWAEQQSRGVVWHERYTKHARTLLPGTAGTAALTADMDLDARLAPGQPAPRVGQTAVFQVLSAGQPLPGLAVQLRSELSPLGLWAQTDADGKVAMRLPLAGRWLLRGTELAISATRPDGWDSRFITLAFEVAR
jgi:hypothetical protein